MQYEQNDGLFLFLKKIFNNLKIYFEREKEEQREGEGESQTGSELPVQGPTQGLIP